ncbi:polyprotein [Phytophthora megakarya]|uniref:Polyprotein n=1 Tax=Phytophthora megakarya TaxID=4795 RepID=A0A225VUN1_9STRA|nr:polyprotein [Phytophthora megakarya]
MSAQQIAAQDFDYRGLVGSLQYLVRGIRPDIANAARELSKYLSCYNKTHWVAARRVLKYLKGTSTYGLLLDGNSRTVTYEVYTDASFACQTKERKSVSDLHGYKRCVLV